MVGYITIPDFKITFIAIVIKLHNKNRETDQWNRAENPYISSRSLSLLIFNQKASHTGSGIMVKERVKHLESQVVDTAGQLHI